MDEHNNEPRYVTFDDVKGIIPPQFLTQGLDDDGDGQPDPGVFDVIARQAGHAIDGRLGQRYGTPFVESPGQPIPPVVRQSAVIFVAETIYGRRGVTPENNPWTGQANAQRAKLDRIGRGEEPLTPELQRKDPSASIITERTKTSSRFGLTSI